MEKILLDSYVLLDVILNSDKAPLAKKYLADVEKGKVTGVVSTFCLLEVKYHVMKRLGHEKGEDACFLIRRMPNMEVISVSKNIAELAADIRNKYYDKKNRPMSFGDAVHIATAIESNCSRVVSGESDFKDIEEIKSEIY